ncbi:hypothetical protein ACHAWX_007482 [Stephanocyclus meneghinianus]
MEKMPLPNEGVDDCKFRLAIQQQLRVDGVFDEITARVRASILLSLSNTTANKPEVNHGLEEMAWQSLVYHFLGDRRFVHTLSVYSAECGMVGHSHVYMTIDDCMKALGLSRFWNELKDKQDDGRDNGSQGGISLLLRFVAHLSASQQLYSSMDRKWVSVSVQTESAATSTSSGSNKESEYINPVDQHHARLGKKENVSSMEQRIIEIERDLRHEMNEKLRLSAKKQAIHATRRLEDELKEEAKRMQYLIDAERVKCQQVEREWTEKAAHQKLAMEKELREMARKLEIAVLAKDTLESDIGLMNEMKKKQMEDRARELDAIDEQKRRLQSEINETALQKDAVKATELMCASLQCEKDSWLAERDELLDEIKLLHKQLTSAHKAKDIIQQSLSQLKSDHVKQSQTQRIKENHLKSQLQNLEEKYQKATCDLEKTRLELETARNEVSSLHCLLRQTQSALESVTFRGEADSFKHGVGFRTSDLRNLHLSEISRHSFGVGSTRAPSPSTSSSRPKTSSSILERSGPNLAESSSFSIGKTAFKLSGIGDVNDTRQWNDSSMPQLDSEGHQTSSSLVKPMDNIHQKIVDHHTIPEDPPSCLAGDRPDSKSLKENDNSTNKQMCQPVRTASLIYEQQRLAKPNHAIKKPMKAIIHDKPDDDVSAISEAVSQSDLATEEVHSSKVVEFRQHEQSEPCEEIRNASDHDDNGTRLSASKEKKEACCSDDNSLKMPLSPVIFAASAPNDTFTTDHYTESFHSENEQNGTSTGGNESNKSNYYSGDARAKNYTTSAIHVESSESYSPHRETDKTDIDTPRSISSSSSSNGYSASFYTED